MSDPGRRTQQQQQPPHIALFPSSGMGHLTPFLRLAASLHLNHNFQLTLITIHPTVSLAESNFISQFLSAFPQITPKQFHLLPFDPSTAESNDPFFLQFEAIRRSARLLSPLLSSLSPPLSALVTDIFLASAFIPITTELHLPNYILFTSSAMMLSLCAHFPSLVDTISDEQEEEEEEGINIPGLSVSPIPKSWIPPLLLDFTTLFATQFIENGRSLGQANGVLINTFESLEPDSLNALDGVLNVIPIGPLAPCAQFEKGSRSSLPLQWLDDQPDGSVVYVSFGSRTALSKEQIRELGVGLEASGCRFVWVVKSKKVDKEDEEGVEELLGNGVVERWKEKGGLVVKGWVDQGEVLSHRAVSGFVTHCGWNSVTEAVWHGVPMLTWPQSGDQKFNAQVVKKSGVGMWVESWGWGGEKLVKGEDIGVKIKQLMQDEELRLQASHLREESRKAVGVRAIAGLLNLQKSLEEEP